jgi:EAL and modified HD-GYP domain-containing signal transduction protein
MRKNVYVARQLILDAEQNIYGYELLFRNAQQESFPIENDLMATTEVLLNTMNSIGFQKLIGDKFAFINVNEKVLQQHLYEALDRNRFVFELLENTTMSEDLARQIKHMHESGYTFALDDFVFDGEMFERFKPVLPYVSFVKVDLYGNVMEKLKEKLELFHSYDIKLLAEKVETRQDFELCKTLGFDYFQGYFFSKPEIMEGKRIQSDYLGLLDLIQSVRRDISSQEMEEVFKRYPDVTMNLLRFMSSAHYGFDERIGSVRQAIKLIGRKKLLRWLMMMFYTNPNASDRMFTPLLELALQRAKLMENISKLQRRENEEQVDNAFFTGILSLVDVIFQVPMSKVLEDLVVDEDIAKAIQHRAGVLGQMLRLVQAIEVNNVEALSRAMEELHLEPERVNEIVQASYDSFHYN